MNELSGINSGADNLTELTADVVSAYVSHNSLSTADLPKMLGDVYAALKALQSGVVQPPVVELMPAVPVRKSVTPDYIICLDDGKKFKSLKRHLRTSYDLTPAQYREKWSLPFDYPMVAPNYSATRSRLAKDNRLGQKRSEPKTPNRRVARPSVE